MDALTLNEIGSAIAKTKTNLTVTINEISNIMDGTDTAAEITTVTQVKTAAAHKDVIIYKVAKSRVLLPVNGETYVRMVKESALEMGGQEENVQNYTAGESPYQHTDVYPICELKSNPEKKYLYAIYEESTPAIYLHGVEFLTKEQVAEYLTASEAKKLMEGATPTENKTHDIKHAVTVRTISLGNVASIKKVVA